MAAGDEHSAAVGQALSEATGRQVTDHGDAAAQEQVVVLASGNLGLIYLMEESRRLTREEIDERHPQLLDTLRRHPHIGFLMVRTRSRGPIALSAHGIRYLAEDSVEGEDPLSGFSANAHLHLRRTDGFLHVPDILVNSFYDGDLEQGCAFEELISFHGGLGGPQTHPFILHPRGLPMPPQPLVGAAAVHDLLVSWRRALQGDAAARPPAAREAAGRADVLERAS
jgi:hypothetical protein